MTEPPHHQAFQLPISESFQAEHHLVEQPLPRNLKRRYSAAADDPFTAPSAPHFQPAQLHPYGQQSNNYPYRNPSSRAATLVVTHLPTMDPSPTDLNAIFIHPPFIDFPDAHKYKDGLTYNLMALNPEWFLDPVDYITTTGSDPSAIRYPPQLEPPRGWCPTRRKDIKDGWPEGEEPRLRCTFCRRTYAGVNAKSMWRRHVYEKHKIAMSNRRDANNERRGRGSNKENKEDKIFGEEEGSSKLTSMKHPYRHYPASTQGLPTPDTSFELSQTSMDEDEPLSAGPSQSAFPTKVDHDVFQVATSSSTPPLTPGQSPEFPKSGKNWVAESPYNPLLTPSFKHSPARLPSDQPWRFPSPSHPLHSSAQELSLCMLIRGEASPMVSGLDVSPVVILPKHERQKRSIFSSPLAPSPRRERETCSDGEDDKPRRSVKPSPRKLFYENALPTPFTDRIKFRQYRIPESPLGRNFTSASAPRDQATIAKVNDSWRSPGSFISPARPLLGASLLDPIQLEGEDPFVGVLFKSWPGSTPGKVRTLSPPSSTPGGDSPVLRSSQLSQEVLTSSQRSTDGVGLGIGLMEGFLMKDAVPTVPNTPSDDMDLMFIYDDKKAQRKRSQQLALDGSPCVVVGNRRTRKSSSLLSPRKNDNDDHDMHEAAQPKKRRKTISGFD